MNVSIKIKPGVQFFLRFELRDKMPDNIAITDFFNRILLKLFCLISAFNSTRIAKAQSSLYGYVFIFCLR